MSATQMLKDMAVAKVRGVRPDDSVRKAHALMDEFNVDQVPILDDKGILIGVVTRRQLVHIRRDWGDTRVRDEQWNSPEPSELLRSPSTLLDDVFEYLFDNDFALITEDGKTITGIVTINDVAKFLYEQLNLDSP